MSILLQVMAEAVHNLEELEERLYGINQDDGGLSDDEPKCPVSSENDCDSGNESEETFEFKWPS